MELSKLRLLAGINTLVPTTLSSADSNEIRKLAGLPILPESKKHKDESDEAPDEAIVGGEESGESSPTEITVSDAEADTDGDGEVTDEESKEALINKIASHLEGKSAEDISAMLHQVYDAGYADAKKHTEDAVNGTTQDEESADPSAEEEVKESLIKQAVNKSSKE